MQPVVAEKKIGETGEQAALRLIKEAERTGATNLNLTGLGFTTLPEAIGNLIGLTTHRLGSR